MAQSFESTSYGKRNGAARGALKSTAEDVIEDIAELRRDVAKLAEAAGHAAKVEVSTAGARIDHLKRRMRGRAEDGVNYLSEHVRERPAAAMGVAMGVGLILGMAFAPRR